MDNTKPRTVWFRRKRKDLGQAFGVLSDHPQVLRPNGSGSVLRNVFTGQKRQVSPFVQHSVRPCAYIGSGNKASHALHSERYHTEP